jgi:hypothetical protein
MDPDQTARRRRLDWIHAGGKHTVGFVMERLIYIIILLYSQYIHVYWNFHWKWWTDLPEFNDGQVHWIYSTWSVLITVSQSVLYTNHFECCMKIYRMEFDHFVLVPMLIFIASNKGFRLLLPYLSPKWIQVTTAKWNSSIWGCCKASFWKVGYSIKVPIHS